MKKIEAIIRPEKLEELREALEKKGHVGMTITEVKGRGIQKGIKLEMVVKAEKVDQVVEVIENVCSSGRIGDGKIFISSVDQVIRLRTREKGREAIG
jgi:nitrogen regulatory protein P-II 1